MIDMLQSRWPAHAEDEIAAVVDVLRSGRVNSLHHGERCRAFEDAFARMCDMPFAISVANGTVALELAFRALGVGPGDEVIVPARSFFASAASVIAVGAKPVFVDVELESGNLNPGSVRQHVSSHTRAILCVHLAGWPCRMDELQQICSEHGLYLIEDCAQAHGATFDGRPVGSFGDAACFSFCTDKIMSTGGEGGMLLLRDEAAFERAWSYKDHGKARARMVPGGGCEFRWLHQSFGTNWRMTEMQAAIGLAQLRKLPEWLSARRRNAAVLASALRDVPGLVVDDPSDRVGHAYYKYYVRVAGGSTDPARRNALAASILRQGVACGAGSCPEIYLEEAFRGTSSERQARLPNARQLGASSLMFQCDHTLAAEVMERIARIARSAAFETLETQAAA
jgi:dTDP-4-amino-4,6-dideoxygalactose transaminase